jgi:predicted acyltransferase
MTIFFMIVVNTPGSWDYVYSPLRHAKWDGLTPTDLVFPFFMFIAGVSMCLSYQKFKEGSNKAEWMHKAVLRGFYIFLVGLLLSWYPFFTKSIAELRIFGVLQRIGLSFLLAALLTSLFNRKHLGFLVVGILALYSGLLFSVGEGALTLEENLVRKIDLWLFGEGHVYKGYGIPFDPEGLLSTIPAVGTVLLGYITGDKITAITDRNKQIQWLVSTGLFLLVTSLILNFTFIPINKPIWSSSYVLVTAGLGMMLLSALIWIIDVLSLKKWTYVFHVFGLNPLISYVLSGLFVKTALLIKISDVNLYNWLFQQVFQPAFGNYLGSFLFAITYAFFIWFFAWLLFRKNRIIRL